MTLSVYVLGREVATLEAIGDFKSSLAVLHPVFQMNLPEGYLLQVLQEQFGPHIGASPMALLSVIGRTTPPVGVACPVSGRRTP